MERLKGYIIRLANHNDSCAWAQHAMNTGMLHNWQLQFFDAIDGRQIGLEQHNIAIYKEHKKCLRYMARPGTQGCFLSHWNLWHLCAQGTEPIMIFEHDVEFVAEPPNTLMPADVIKFEGFRPSKPIPAGQWWEGARAYAITPIGARKILEWVKINGAMPADWMLCDGIVDVIHDQNNRVRVRQNKFSFTRDLV